MSQYRDPLRDLMALQDRMNRLFDEAAQKSARAEGDEGEIERTDWTPAADVYNLEEEYLIVVDLPGVSRDALGISLNDNRLFIQGERPADAEAQGRTERPVGKFLREFGPLPQTVDQKTISAEYKDGVLRLRLPKRREQKQQRVEIKVS
ncbi:MAG: Hsp20/alpha crystallin family protein [Acidobacteria bacterium]|nr:Hsp20/alpha crystallin family protein [Acidobacteriota bacterium]